MTDSYAVSAEKYAEVLAKIPGVELKPGLFVCGAGLFVKNDTKNIDKTTLSD